MRALVLIVTCVILLAILQASYLVVQAHAPEAIHVTDDAHEEKKHHHHDNKHVPMATTRQPSNRQRTEKDVHNMQYEAKQTLGSDPQSRDNQTKPGTPAETEKETKRERYHRKICRVTPEKCRWLKGRKEYKDKNIRIEKRGRKEQKEKDEKKHKEKMERKKQKERKSRRNRTKITSESSPLLNPKNNNSSLKSKPKKQEKPDKPPKTNKKDDTIKKQAPAEGTTTVEPDKSEHSGEKAVWRSLVIPGAFPNATKHLILNHPQTVKADRMPNKDNAFFDPKHMIEEPSIYDQMMGDSPTPETDAGRQRRGERKRVHGKTRRNHHKKQPCSTDKDCGKDECCLTRKSGRKTCHKGVKLEDKRCSDTCKCLQGLQCFASKLNKKGNPKKRNINGRCTPPSKIDLANGFLLPAPPSGHL